MHTTHLAIMMTCLLGLSGCHHPKLHKQPPPPSSQQASPLQLVSESGQTYADMLTDVMETLYSNEANIPTISVTKVLQDIQTHLTNLTNSSEHTSTQANQLARFQTYQDRFEHIQDVLQTFLDQVSATQWVEAAHNQNLNQRLTQFADHVQLDNEDLTLDTLNTLLTQLNNLVQLEQAANTEPNFETVLSNTLNNDYDNALINFNQTYQLQANHQSLTLATPAYIQQLIQFLEDIDATNLSEAKTLYEAMIFTQNATILYQAFQGELSDQQRAERFEAYFPGIRTTIVQTGLSDGDAVYNAITNQTQQTTEARLSPQQVKKLLNHPQAPQVMPFILSSIIDPIQRPAAGWIAQKETWNLEVIAEVIANLIAYVNDPNQQPTKIQLADYANIPALFVSGEMKPNTTIAEARRLAAETGISQAWQLLFNKPQAVIQQLINAKQEQIELQEHKKVTWDSLFKNLNLKSTSTPETLTIGDVLTPISFLNHLSESLIQQADHDDAAKNNQADDQDNINQYPLLKRTLKKIASQHYPKAQTAFEQLIEQDQQPKSDIDNLPTPFAYLKDLNHLIKALQTLIDPNQTNPAFTQLIHTIETAIQTTNTTP
jgi:hypothetical protein